MKINFKRHLTFAVVITIVHLIFSWFLIMTAKLSIVWLVISPSIVIGGALYGLKDIKSFLEGILSGLVYALTAFLLYSAAFLVLWSCSFTTKFSLIAVGAGCTGLLLTAGIYGWINANKEHKIKLNEVIDPTHE